MLIIAIPKSASTSLVHTLGEIHSLTSKQEFKEIKDLRTPSEYKILARYHSDVREIDLEILVEWNRTDIFYKQHIPPTVHNLALIDDTKKVVLLRKPRDIILAYRRADIKGLHKKREEFTGCVSEEKWIRRAKEIGLYQELENFYNGWSQINKNCLIVYFDDLVNNEEQLLKEISNFFSLPVNKKNIELKKYRYSNYNSAQRILYKVKKRIDNLFK